MRAHRAPQPGTRTSSPTTQHRPMVERSIAWLTAGNNRRLRYLGVAKTDAWFRLRAGAVNLKLLLSLGLTVREGAFVVETPNGPATGKRPSRPNPETTKGPPRTPRHRTGPSNSP